MSVDKDVEKGTLIHGGNVKWHKQFNNFIQLDMNVPHDSVIYPRNGMYTREMKTYIHTKAGTWVSVAL